MCCVLDIDRVMFDTSGSNAREEKKSQRQVVEREFEPNSLAMFKNPLRAWRGLLPTLQ
jgi:hypothetical protein